MKALRHYHRDENFRIIKQRDDLICALRYAVMMKRSGRLLRECDGVGYGNMPFAAQRRAAGDQQVALDVHIDPFTGEPLQ